jgi:hypothetical protein
MWEIALVGLVIGAIGTAILGWRHKRKLEGKLGRKVGKLEANSISNWMEASDEEQRK